MAKAKTFSFKEALRFGFFNFFEHFALFFKVGITFLGLFLVFMASVGLIIWHLFGIRHMLDHVHEHPVVQAFGLSCKSLGGIGAIHHHLSIGSVMEFGQVIFSNLILFGTILLIADLICTGLKLGYTKINLAICDKKTPPYKTLFSCFHLILKYWIAKSLYMLIVAVGLALFVVPGIILAIKFGFYKYLIVDKECGIIEAFKGSCAITDGAKWHLFFFYALLIVLSSIATSVILGAFLVIPIFALSGVFAYRALRS